MSEYFCDEILPTDHSRYLICPFTKKVLFVSTKSNDAQAYCQKCKGVHGFSKMNKAMGGIEYGIKNNTWVETW